MTDSFFLNSIIQFKTELAEKKLLYLRIKVAPNAKQTAWQEILADGTVKIELKAPSQEGKANQALINFLKKELQAREVKILNGKSSKLKLVKISCKIL